LIALAAAVMDTLEQRAINTEIYTVGEIADLCATIQVYYWTHDAFPGPTFEDVAVALSTPDYGWRFTGKRGRAALQGIDAWGNHLYYKRLGPAAAVIGSMGPNAVVGDTDDIVFRVTPEEFERLTKETVEVGK
jgi:hypothetical protein